MKQKQTGETSIETFKGFDLNWQCRGFQYEVGKSYEHRGEVAACSSGFHACKHPLDVFLYYPPGTSKFASVTQSGDLHTKGSDTKVASRSLSIKAEIGLAGLIAAAVEYTFKNALPVDAKSLASATGAYGAASATGAYGAASATGAYGAASATGACGAASATGSYGAASATGSYGAASATGSYGAASATGKRGAASATGACGAASATGKRGAASATGACGAASATGYSGAASATGYSGAASATGYSGAASATGYSGAASATGENSIACGLGINCRAQAGETGAIVLAHRDIFGKLLSIKSSLVGKNGIKAGVWYTLNSAGEFSEYSAD